MSQARRLGPYVDIADCDVRLTPQHPQLGRSFQFELDFGVSGGEPVQAVYQPPRCERRLAGDSQASRRNAPYRFHSSLNSQKPASQFGGELLPGLGQFHRPGETPKKLAPNVLFEAPHVPTDRRLRYVQLTRSLRETQAPCSRLEGAQREQGWWALCRHLCGRPIAGNCSHEFKLSDDGRQIVCRISAVAVECAPRG